MVEHLPFKQRVGGSRPPSLTMSAYVYIIESLLDSSYYIGSTHDLNKRLEKHNAGMSRYTSKKTPWNIIYYEVFQNMRLARIREAFLKKQRNREFYNKLINDFKEQQRLIKLF